MEIGNIAPVKKVGVISKKAGFAGEQCIIWDRKNGTYTKKVAFD
jgi:hypothetical protein